ncbi:hypothetical protein C7293_19050 [filamentous cyanobacterium CCT1]|nr:hypothetical protein C7293_19050 [filamentous cyanobacterium CCT1]PSN76085.1 hypothetical protein C8B47_29210 [filamentous cyanobacterium CCP4]
MLSSLLSQFRQRYPQGSLLSDLLTIHDGLYVVRVCAGENGMTLASGLGANTTLEAAEDIATTRALERLSLSVAPPSSLMPSPGLQANGLESSAPAVPTAPPAPLKFKLAPTASPQVGGPDPEGQSLPSILDPLELVDLPEAPDLPPTTLASPPLPKPDSLLNEPADRVDEHDEFMDLGSGPVVSVDLSDIIAQTDVELQRLGWSVSQGREFLEKTYGKRSRHDLTDDELLEFLLYLETQSASNGP